MIGEGKGVTEIAKKYGLSRQRIYQILKEPYKTNQNLTETPGGIVNLNEPKRGVGQGDHRYIDPETGYMIEKNGFNEKIIARIGDPKVTAFVAYHLAMLEMRQGVNTNDVDDLRQRFYNYLKYCMEHAIIPNNMNAYFAIGITREQVYKWKNGKVGTPEHRAFAEELTGFFASIHEQGPTDGVMNPISAMFWQKAHDGMIEASKVEMVVDDPLGQKRSAEEIAAKYADVSLPDD